VLTDFQGLAQRHEFRITLDVGDEIEHLIRPVLHPAPVGKTLHVFSTLNA
jgi:hypothetical protein